jgi:transposase-like protein
VVPPGEPGAPLMPEAGRAESRGVVGWRSTVRAIIYLTHPASRPILGDMKSPATPQTLRDAVLYFANPDRALAFMVAIRWPNGIFCPRCASVRHSFLSTRRIWKCLDCKKQFSVKVGTIFEDSPIGLDKWLPCLWLIANAKNGISSYEVGRALGVTQKSAWFMLHRVRLAMQTPTFGKLGGDVEVDETFIGGRARFMHQSRKERVIKGSRGGHIGKVAVMGLLERHGLDGHSRVRVSVAKSVKRYAVQEHVRANVEPGSNVYSDSLLSYRGLAEDYIHGVIDHGEKYVDGKIHTNGLENFWSLLKRSIKGTYVAVEPFHLFRYLDEQAFRFNNRKDNDAGRFADVASGVVGKRVTYKGLTGADQGESR